MDQDEKLFTFSTASKHVPGHPHASTFWRWCRGGLHGVTLEYVKIGRRFLTSREALDRFFTAVTKADQAAYAATHAPGGTPSIPKQSNRDQAVAVAEEELRMRASNQLKKPAVCMVW
jgi:hypothetical protein